MKRQSRQEIKATRDLCSKIAYDLDTPQKVYLGSVDIICNEPISRNRILISKTANYMASDSCWNSKYCIPFPYACKLVEAVIPQFQQELSKQDQQRIYSNDYKIHINRLVKNLIVNSKEKSKIDKANMSSIERLASAFDINAIPNFDFITTTFTNIKIKPLENQDISAR